MKLTLERVWKSDKWTMGELFVDGIYECFTLELPWRDNQKNISCIPEGTYPIILERSDHFKRILPELKNVPGRDEIKIHIANWPRELLGCIAVGQKRGDGYLEHSGNAFTALYRKMTAAVERGEELYITILSAPVLGAHPRQ